MNLMTWSAQRNSVLVQEFDHDHQELFDLINALAAAVSGHTARQLIPETLARLVDYTTSHFAREEQVMREHGFPGYEEHRREHAALTAKVVQFQADVEAGKRDVTMPVLHFLRDWLIEHTQGRDKLYGVFLNRRGVH